MRTSATSALLFAAAAARGALAQDDYASCATEETAGIKQCESAGSGFTRDQNKAARCPDGKPMEEWTCDDWKCHMFCTNPEHGEDRKSCTNCDVPAIGDTCFGAQKSACQAAVASLDGCDVDCNLALPASAPAGGLALLSVVVATWLHA